MLRYYKECKGGTVVVYLVWILLRSVSILGNVRQLYYDKWTLKEQFVYTIQQGTIQGLLFGTICLLLIGLFWNFLFGDD